MRRRPLEHWQSKKGVNPTRNMLRWPLALMRRPLAQWQNKLTNGTDTIEEPKHQTGDPASESSVVKAMKTPRKSNPRVWFWAKKIIVSEGQEEPAKVALKEARNAVKVWTDGAWKADMKTVLK